MGGKFPLWQLLEGKGTAAKAGMQRVPALCTGKLVKEQE